MNFINCNAIYLKKNMKIYYKIRELFTEYFTKFNQFATTKFNLFIFQ